jgi:hypothetical protein
MNPLLAHYSMSKKRMLRTIEVADAIVMATRIMHGRPVSSECAVVKVTTIREGHEFQGMTVEEF